MNGSDFVKLCKADKCTTQSRSKNGLKYHNKYTEYFGKLGYKGINAKGVFTKRYPYGVVGHCCIGVQYHLHKRGLTGLVPKSKGYIWNTNVYRKWLMTEPTIKGLGKIDWVTSPTSAKVGAIAFKGDGKNKKSATHTCVFVKTDGTYVWTVDFNVGDGKGHNNGTYKKRHRKYFLGFANIPYKDTPEIEKARFPMRKLRFSAIWNTSTPHKNCSGGTPKDYPTDLVGADTGKDWVYAPCDIVCLKVYNKASHGLWFRSVNKVKMPIGTGYLYMMAEHESVSGFKVGQTFKKGEKLFTENKYGNATGNHIHLSCGWSKSIKPLGSGWRKNSKGAWVLYISGVKNIKIYEAFYVDDSFTTVKDTRHKFKHIKG